MADNKPQPVGCFAAMLVGSVVLFFAWCMTPPDDQLGPQIQINEETRAALTPERRKTCDAGIQSGIRNGLIRQQQGDSLYVEDRIWAALPHDVKVQVLAAHACQAYNREPAYLKRGQMVFAYGYRSGKRLAAYSSSGVSFD